MWKKLIGKKKIARKKDDGAGEEHFIEIKNIILWQMTRKKKKKEEIVMGKGEIIGNKIMRKRKKDCDGDDNSSMRKRYR